MEIKPFATKRGPKSALKTQRLAGEEAGRVRHVSHPSRMNGGPSPTSQPTSSDSNTLYFHKSHQGEYCFYCRVNQEHKVWIQFVHSFIRWNPGV
jgi:hypothetical protein